MEEEESFSASVAKLASLLKITFGPQGRSALVGQSSPRQLSVTKSGPQLINLFKGCHPLLDVILKDVEETREMWGEGSKRCLLAILALLHLLGEKRQAISELSRAARLWEDELAEGTEAEFEDKGTLREEVDAVIATSLKSSFPLIVATQLSSILSNHINQVTRASSDTCLINEVEILARDLPHNLVQLHRANLASSFSGKGFLLQAALSKPTPLLSHTMRKGVSVSTPPPERPQPQVYVTYLDSIVSSRFYRNG